MKRRLSYIAVILLGAGATGVNAASSVDLSVTGKITPAACMPQLSNGGMVDHGKISFKDLNAGENTLPQVSLQMNVSCDAATLFAVKSTDNRKGTASNKGLSSFGLGLGEGDHKVGFYNLTMENVLGDGAVLPVVESVNGNTWFYSSTGQIWQPEWMRSVSGRGNPDYTPVAIQTLAADLIVATTINKPRALSAEMPIDGSATMDIVYL
jgi:hypothetical protein